MNSTFMFTLLYLICYILLGSALPLSERDDSSSPFNTDLFEAFQAYPKTPKNVVRKYTFELKKVKLAPDGFTRLVWTVNGQSPGPMIRANKGDTFNITVINNFGDPATIHWHGIDQKGVNWYDGVPGITQCPIPNGVNFSYIFNLTQSGTYWYHSHFLAQYVDGLKGPIVIHDPDDPHESLYDYEYVLTISDWYHTPTGDPGMLPLFRNPLYFAADPYPDSGEISGVGQYNCTIPKCIPPKFATYKVEKGKKYRFRIINMSAMAHFKFSIDDHPLTIIEVEGTAVYPITVDVLSVNIAQRYSVIVNADQPIGNYWIRAYMTTCSVPPPRPPPPPPPANGTTNGTINANGTTINNGTTNANGTNPNGPNGPKLPPGAITTTINNGSAVFANMNITGILRYDGAPDTIPTSEAYPANITDCSDQDPTTLNPVSLPSPIPVECAKRIILNVAVTGPPLQEATINNSSMIMDFSYPSNQKVIDGAKFIKSDNAYSYDIPNQCVEILLNNTENRTHPFHLHGHSFWVVAQGPMGSYNQSLSSLQYNFSNPVFRDTATINPWGLLAIRYYADNPGVWLIHCHIEWHVEMGMVAQLIESPSLFKNFTIPDSVRALCEATDNSYS